MKNFIFLSLIALFALTGCKKSKIQAPGATKIDTDIYIAGTVQSAAGGVAVYWKNGVLTKISDTTKDCEVTGITANGTDIYVTGYYYGSKTIPVYWKNGVEVHLTLPSPDTATRIYPNAIAVNSSGVYVVGQIVSSKGFSAVYWKDNRVPVALSNNKAFALGIALNGAEVDISGGVYSASAGNSTSAWWKNGEVQLSKDSLRGSANAIALNGPDVYTVGSVYNHSTLPTVTFWRNNVPTYVTDGSSFANAYALAVKDNVVHIAGLKQDQNGRYVAAYWKGSTPVPLPLPAGDNSRSTTSGIALSGNNVYVTGYTYPTDSAKAVYWKNGKMATLPGVGNYCYTEGIVIITHPH